MQDGAIENEEPGNIFAGVLDLIPLPENVAWNLRIGIEGALITLVSVYVVRGINVPEAGLVGLSLASAAMVPRFNTILATNRERIWAAPGTGRAANTQSAISGISIFGGMFLGFLLMAIFAESGGFKADFAFILKETGFKPGDVLSPERFALGYEVIIHNLFVLVALAILALLYRSLGTMIALGWNASVWAITLALFIQGGSGGDTSQFLHTVIVIVAVMPHLIVEALGYVIGALSGVFLSRGIMRYEYSDPRLRRVLTAVLVLAGVSVALIIVGGLMEINYAPRVLGLAQ
jgi:hypothetical protein